jgi:hypothetical protein
MPGLLPAWRDQRLLPKFEPRFTLVHIWLCHSFYITQCKSCGRALGYTIIPMAVKHTFYCLTPAISQGLGNK